MQFLQDFMDNIHIVFVVVFFIVGLVFIIKGGDWFVDSASWIAEVTGIPKLIVGATIVSIGTTLPELLVSLIAAVNGEYDMAAGNAIGSVTVNVAVILSLALIFMPSAIKRKDYILKSVLMFLPLVVMFLFSFQGNQNSYLPLFAGIIMICLFVVNITENVVLAVKANKREKIELKESYVDVENAPNSTATQREKPTKKKVFLMVGTFLIGALAIFVGAQLLQSSATTIALKMKMSKQVIALTIVAIGTSLPELVTTVTAIVKKENSLSVGNIIGANIIDLSLILSICGIIAGGKLPMSAQTLLFDIPVCFLVGTIALIPALISGKFKRWQGFANIAIYVAYVVLMIIGVGKIGIAV